MGEQEESRREKRGRRKESHLRKHLKSTNFSPIHIKAIDPLRTYDKENVELIDIEYQKTTWQQVVSKKYLLHISLDWESHNVEVSTASCAKRFTIEVKGYTRNVHLFIQRPIH